MKRKHICCYSDSVAVMFVLKRRLPVPSKPGTYFVVVVPALSVWPYTSWSATRTLGETCQWRVFSRSATSTTRPSFSCLMVQSIKA